MQNRWLIIAMLMGYAALGHFNRIGISVAGDEVFIPQLEISATRMGWVYTIFLIVYTSAMLPGGWLIDRIGAKQALTLFGLVMGTFVALTGVLGWLVSGPMTLWTGLMIIRSFAGLGNAPLHPAAAHVVSDEIQAHKRASANGMITASALVGIAFCYPGYGWLIDTLTWQWAFVVGGCVLIGYAVCWHCLSGKSSDASKHAAYEDPIKNPTTIDWSLISDPRLWLVTASYACYSYFQYLVFYWMGYYFKNVLLIPESESRWASFWIMIAMGTGMALGGRSTDVCCQQFGTTIGRRVIILVGMGFGAVFGFIAIQSEGFVAVTACLAVSMAATGMVEGVFWTTATDIGGRSRGLCGAFMNTGGNAGGLVSPVLTPIIAQQLGWQGSIILACAISGLGSLLWLFVRFQEKGDEKPI